ncbi:MAG: diguanylate cyclase [Desulfobacteraceae bacterium]|nr:diguanylate cyclase [Desulfobacteraceae bacterium]
MNIGIRFVFTVLLIGLLLSIYAVYIYGFQLLYHQVEQDAKKNLKKLTTVVTDEVDHIFHKVALSTQNLANAYIGTLESLPSPSEEVLNQWLNKSLVSEKTLYFSHDGKNSPDLPMLSPHLSSLITKRTRYPLSIANELETMKRIQNVFRSTYENFRFSWVYMTTVNDVESVYPYVPFKFSDYGYQPTKQHFFKAADFKNKTFGWEEPYNDLGGQGVMVTVSYPFYGKQGNLFGVTSHDITVGQLFENVVSQLELYDNSIIFIISEKGKAIAANQKRFSGEIEAANKESYKGVLHYGNTIRKYQDQIKNSEYPILNDLSDNVIRRFQEDHKIIDFIYKGDIKYIVVSSRLKNTGWYVVNAVPYHIVFSHVKEANFTVVLGVIIAGILFLFVGWVFIKYLIQPISDLSQTAIEIGKGNLYQDIPLIGKWEIEELSKSFGKMVEGLKRVKSLEREKYALQKSAFEIQRKLNEELEQKVAERTASLEEANKKLERLSTIDSLTSLYNRRYFKEGLEREWERHHRSDKPLSFILCDIDYFKKYNDHYGHLAGDKCICDVARQIIMNCKRPSDIPARYGGEEFAIILPQTDAKGAAELAESIYKDIAGLKIPHETSSVKDIVSVSLGISTMVPNQDSNSKIIIAFADEALYESKKNGRDRITIKNF